MIMHWAINRTISLVIINTKLKVISPPAHHMDRVQDSSCHYYTVILSASSGNYETKIKL